MSEIICSDTSIHKDGIYDTDNNCLLLSGRYTANDSTAFTLLVALLLVLKP